MANHLNLDQFLRKLLGTTLPRGFAIIFSNLLGARPGVNVWQTLFDSDSTWVESDLLGPLLNPMPLWTDKFRAWSRRTPMTQRRTHRPQTNNNDILLYYMVTRIARFSQIIIISITLYVQQPHVKKKSHAHLCV